MKSRTFEVPLDVMGDFAKVMDDNGFDNLIEGVVENGDIIVRVDYEADQRDVINEIHDIIDNYNDNRDDEEDEEEEDEDEEEEEDDDEND